ncbi:oligomeric Golgi complex subunit 8 [Lipomyces japonicus]|uniref:oligomeric Golgi complex subunit 8 n=1 Tax=Lipomyces japonicus TaxID=56871 RepID=UPI0034CF2172
MADPLLDILKKNLPNAVSSATKLSNGKNSAQLEEYLVHLRELSISDLPTEERQLDASLDSVDKSLTRLAIESRPYLISTSATLESFTANFNLLSESVPKLSEFGSQLENEVANFNPVNDRQASATLLANVDKVLDILELPSLVLTCVRNGYYAEALDLVGHVRRLAIRFKGIAVIEMIQSEVDDALLEMTTLLLRLLRENVQLPTAIKVISYLRRLKPFQESQNPTLELQHIYLLSRTIHLKAQLKSLEPLRSMPEKYLKRYIELFREFVFAAIVGFRSIFPKEDADSIALPMEYSSSYNDAAQSKTDAETPFGESHGTVNAGDQLLSSFIYNTTYQLKQTVKDILPLIPDNSTYASLYLQVIYSSQSLGRVGGEFWSVLENKEELADRLKEGGQNPWLIALEKQRDLAKKLKSY